MTDTQAQLAPTTLLFIDDEENILSALRRLFRPLGYRILIANSAIKGLKMMESEEVDLIVCDMRMPEMNGDAFFEQAAEKWPDTMRILLTGYADISSTIAAINKGSIYSYISKPWNDDDIKINVKRALDQREMKAERLELMVLINQQNEELTRLNSTLEKKVTERTNKLNVTMEQLEVTHESLKRNYTDSIKAFSNIIAFRGGSAPGHARRVADMGFKLAMSMGMTKTEARDVLFAGLLNDIGRIGLSDHLVTQPFEILSVEEQAVIISHNQMAEGLLMALDLLQVAATFICARYERYDGSGGPHGLKADEIPLGTAILAVVDDYDALQKGGLFADMMTAAEAMAFIVEHQGARYSPLVVTAFAKYLAIESNKRCKTTRYVVADELEPGMVLGKDLATTGGMVLLAKGHKLDAMLIDKVRHLAHITENSTGVYIEMED